MNDLSIADQRKVTVRVGCMTITMTKMMIMIIEMMTTITIDYMHRRLIIGSRFGFECNFLFLVFSFSFECQFTLIDNKKIESPPRQWAGKNYLNLATNDFELPSQCK